MSAKDNQNYEEALGYAQLLKLDGKTDEEVIQELSATYQLSYRDAHEILTTFKTEKKEIYNAQIGTNIKWAASSLLVLTLIGIAYLTLITQIGSKGLTIFVACFFAIAVGALLFFIFRLLGERAGAPSLSAEIQISGPDNKIKRNTLYFLLVCVVVAALTPVYISLHGDISVNRTQWQQIDNIVLKEDCKEDYVSGKHRNYYYHFAGKKTGQNFRWYEHDHFYRFVNEMRPDKAFAAGDTVTVWVDNDINVDPLPVSANGISVHDVQKKDGRPMLNIAAYNVSATKDFKDTSIAFSCVLTILIGLMIFGGNREKRFGEFDNQL